MSGIIFWCEQNFHSINPDNFIEIIRSSDLLRETIEQQTETQFAVVLCSEEPQRIIDKIIEISNVALFYICKEHAKSQLSHIKIRGEIDIKGDNQWKSLVSSQLLPFCVKKGNVLQTLKLAEQLKTDNDRQIFVPQSQINAEDHQHPTVKDEPSQEATD